MHRMNSLTYMYMQNTHETEDRPEHKQNEKRKKQNELTEQDFTFYQTKIKEFVLHLYLLKGTIYRWGTTDMIGETP